MFPLLLFLIKFDQYAIIAAALQIIWIFQKERLPVEFHRENVYHLTRLLSTWRRYAVD